VVPGERAFEELEAAPRRWPDVRIIVRGDSGARMTAASTSAAKVPDHRGSL
jgi:hypothetical protein